MRYSPLHGLQWSFFVPAACYVFTLKFALIYDDMYRKDAGPNRDSLTGV